jgi:hypothetical protein
MVVGRRHAASSRHLGRSKKLSAHIWNHKHEAKHKVAIEWELNVLKSILSHILPPARPQPLNLPKQNHQLLNKYSNSRDCDDISHSNYHFLPSNKARYKISVFKIGRGGEREGKKELRKEGGRERWGYGRRRCVRGLCMINRDRSKYCFQILCT